jgi:hypothetical protein
MTDYKVSSTGEVLVDGALLGVNIFQPTGARLMRGGYERTGFGLTQKEREAAVELDLLRE